MKNRLRKIEQQLEPLLNRPASLVQRGMDAPESEWDELIENATDEELDAALAELETERQETR